MHQGFGMTAGLISGLGFAYRQFGDRWGLQVGGLAQMQPNDYQYNLGIQAMKNFWKGNLAREKIGK